jgi:hypothetical protein
VSRPNPATPRRRKQRLVRDEETADDELVMLRASGSELAGAIDDIVRDALRSAAIYDVEVGPSRREALFGVSVFALRGGAEVGDVLDRFSSSPNYLAVTVGSLRRLGFAVLPTGSDANHFDVQLNPGIDGADFELVADFVIEQAARRLVEAAGPLLPNPAYAGSTRRPGGER